jgi:dual specificity MAP kinase phosphatase
MMRILEELRRLLMMLGSQGLWLTLLAGIDKAGRWLTGRPVWRFSRITPQIVLGGQPDERVLPRLKQYGITGVINMREEHDYVELALAGPLNYLHLPTIDNTAPTLEHLCEGIAFMAGEIRQGGQVYIHCWEGLGRGPTMLAAYLVTCGMTPDEAWARIRKVRPFIRPTDTQKAQIERLAREGCPPPMIDAIEASHPTTADIPDPV